MPDRQENLPRFGWSDEEAAAVRREARRQADVAEHLVHQISHRRLAELRRAPATAAAKAVKDPALTETDRQSLVEHLARASEVQVQAPKGFRRGGYGWRIVGLPMRVRGRLSLRGALCTIATVAVAIPFALAVRATPVGRVVLARDGIVRWQWHGSYVGMSGYQAGSRFDVVRNDADASRTIVRGWVPKRGYYTAEIGWRDLRSGPKP